jgi:hypothetical protein
MLSSSTVPAFEPLSVGFNPAWPTAIGRSKGLTY